MRVMYGVCGDGMGHAMRSAVVAQHLLDAGHELYLFSSGHAYTYLRERFHERVVPIVGLSATIRQNKVDKLATVLSNVVRHVALGGLNHLAAADGLVRVRPDIVISDFDPWTARYARLMRVPMIAVDNIHFMTRCDHPRPARRDEDAAKTTRRVVASMVPGANHYLVLTFAGARVIADRTTLHMPILRRKILAARSIVESRDHVVAYFNAKSSLKTIVDAFAPIGPAVLGMPRVLIYGQHGAHLPDTIGNVTLMPFDEDRFIESLATCRAVVGGAGFTLMTESFYLGKPILAVPFAGQYEQILNAEYANLTDFGERADEVTRSGVLGFLQRAPAYAERLRAYGHDQNREVLAAVEQRMHAAVDEGAVPATDYAAAAAT